jgi:hypothetical protein
MPKSIKGRPLLSELPFLAFTFDISMGDALGVKMCDGRNNLGEDRLSHILGELSVVVDVCIELKNFEKKSKNHQKSQKTADLATARILHDQEHFGKRCHHLNFCWEIVIEIRWFTKLFGI